MHTQNTQNTPLFYHPLYLLKHRINGTTQRNNNNTEDQKAPNSKQHSVQAKQTGYMIYMGHLKLGSGMICGTAFRFGVYFILYSEGFKY